MSRVFPSLSRPGTAPGWYPIEGRPGYWYWNGSRWTDYRDANPPHYGPTPRRPLPTKPLLAVLCGVLALFFGLGLGHTALGGLGSLLLILWPPLLIGGGLWLIVRLLFR